MLAEAAAAGEPEARIVRLEALLPISSMEDRPWEWADARLKLGKTYGQSLHGDRAQNIERAIAFFEAAGNVWTRETFLKEWAATQHNLGVAYFEPAYRYGQMNPPEHRSNERAY